MSDDIPTQVLAKSASGTGLIPISDIIIPPDRIREDTPSIRSRIDTDLAPSIVDCGLIHPPVLNYDETSNTYTLVAGWCRLQACIALGLTEIPYNLVKDLHEDQRLELELEENLRRSDMTWQENVLAIARIHKLKTKLARANSEPWGLKQTGAVIGLASTGHISECLKVAEHLRAGDEEVTKAPTFSQASKIIGGRVEDAIVEELMGSSMPKPKKRKPSDIGPVSSSQGIDLTAAIDSTVSVNESLSGPELEVDLSQILFHMDNKEWFDQAGDECVDLVYTDIPYGIDMSMLDYGADDLDRVAEAHDIDENVSQMRPFLMNAYRVLKDKKYCFFWYDLKHHEKLYNWGKEAGFDVLPYPLIWCKEHPCRNRAAGKWPTKAVEYVMVMGKGTATLREAWTKNYILADGSTERKTQRNPFAKPFAVSKWILEKVAVPGDLMLDCYAGEGSLVRCAINMGLRVIAVEKDEKHIPRLEEHIKRVYSEMSRGKATFQG